MKALVRDRYGGVENLLVRDVPMPDVGADRILIQVRAASLNRSDWEVLVARPRYVRVSGVGFRRPQTPWLGTDVAGTVAAVGDDVTAFEPGDDVFGDTMYHTTGTFAEYVAVPAKAPLIAKPEGLPFETASALPQAGTLAFQGLRGVEPQQRVLINGGGGGAGTFAIQIAKARGAHVTGVDNGHKQDLMRRLGADQVIDYTRERYKRRHGPFDLILDFMAGRGVFANRRVLAPGGEYRVVGGSVPRLLATAVVGRGLLRFGGRRLGVLLARPNRDDLQALTDLVVAREIEPAVGGSYSLEEAPEAFRRLADGTLQGKAVLTVE